MESSLQSLKNEIEVEVHQILDWWRKYAPDKIQGGFAGEINQDNQIINNAEKGSVLHARILWTFSAAYSAFNIEEDKLLADYAYEYLSTRFIDPDYNGVYWSIHADGSKSKDRKQIYAQAFAIYGLAEYYKISRKHEALQLAIDLFYTIERFSKDEVLEGYFEAFSRDWSILEDLRLSDKDRNDPKTMNTHLHIIEAYANLYKVWKDPQLLEAIKGLLVVFEDHIINKQSGHLDLFFDGSWRSMSRRISYGHDIEAAWLLPFCVEQTELKSLKNSWSKHALRIADAAVEGLQSDGSFIHEYDADTGHEDRHREWWVGAEGMVGFLHAYQLSLNPDYLHKVFGLWAFTQQHILDPESGEWKWGVQEDYSEMDAYKMGFWKCPYHNVRACLEIIRRIEVS